MSDSACISDQEFEALMSLTGLCHAEIATLISQRYWWREGHLHFLHLKDYSSLFGLDLTPNSHFEWKSLGNLPFIWKLSICHADQLGADTIEALLTHPNLKEILFDSCIFLPEACAAFLAITTTITGITFQKCAMPAFPQWVANIGSLKGLDFSPELFTEEFIDPDSPPRSFSSLPDLSHLTSLCSLFLGSCGIGSIRLAHLPPSLQFLDLQDNEITEFAPKVGELPRLWELNLSHNPLSTLDLTHLPELMQFRGAKANLSSFPKDLYGKLQLHLLDLSGNSVPLDDVDWGQFPALGTLNLSQTGLAEFPPAFKNFSIVILAENSLSSLPPDWKHYMEPNMGD